MLAYTQTYIEVCSWITGVCIPDNCYKLGCVMSFMFINNLKYLQIHKDDRDMKIRTCFIMKFVYSHNVIMCWNNMKPLLLTSHFTPAVNTTTVTRENKTCRCPRQHVRAGAVYIMKCDRKIFFLKCEWKIWTEVLFLTLCLLPSCPTCKLHQRDSFVRALAVPFSYLLFDQLKCNYAVHDSNITVQENLYE